MPGPLSPQGRQKILMVLWAAVIVLSTGVFVRTMWLLEEVGRGNTYDRVKSVLVRRLGVNPRQVTPQASLENELRSDVQEFVLSLEEEFQIDIAEEEAGALTVVQDAVNCVDRHLAAARRKR
jgi:acyl carrier protein